MSLKQQETLPHWVKNHLPYPMSKYTSIKSIPQSFSDSTHLLWRLERSELDGNNHILKLCNNTDSPFWSVMRDLFDYELRTEIGGFSHSYSLIKSFVSLDIPMLIQAESLDKGRAYILTSELKGSALSSTDVNSNDQMLRKLAVHLAELHSVRNDVWGSLNKPVFDSDDWTKRLTTTLIESTKKWGGVFLHSNSYLKQSLNACESLKVDKFVPMMTDLRWDQFLQSDGEISSLVDLDAFVFAPVELDFVILEYLLSPEQLDVFKEAYRKYHEIPAIDPVRVPYRLLLFYMQILGETDLDTWMSKESLF